MNKSLLLCIGIPALLVALFIFVPQDATTVREKAEANAALLHANTEEFSALLEQAKKDLSLDETTSLDLQATEENYFDFSAGSAEGGGVGIIAYRNSKGTFETVWEGQDYPDCFLIENWEVYFYEPEQRIYTVPISLVPQCLETRLKERTTIFSQLALWVQNAGK